MSRLINHIAIESLMIQRGMTPRKTGNLKFNATRMQIKNYGFDIIVDFRHAIYGYWQNEPGFKHEGWIENAFEAVEMSVGEMDATGSRFSKRYPERVRRGVQGRHENIRQRERENLKSINRFRRIF